MLSLKVLALLKQHHQLTIAELLELTQANRKYIKNPFTRVSERQTDSTSWQSPGRPGIACDGIRSEI